MIPQAAPMRRIARYRAEVEAAMARVLDGTTAIGGEEVAAFEAGFAAMLSGQSGKVILDWQ